MRHKQFAPYFGWFGASAVVVAYAAINFKLLTAEHLTYQLLNLLGALCIIVGAAARKDYPPAALNSIWAVIAIISIIKLYA